MANFLTENDTYCFGLEPAFLDTKQDNLINSKSVHVVPPLSQPFFHFLTPPRFGALNLPEVNQFTGNCFRMVRIVLKINSLKLRYPTGVTGRLPLCPIMPLVHVYFIFYIVHSMYLFLSFYLGKHHKVNLQFSFSRCFIIL